MTGHCVQLVRTLWEGVIELAKMAVDDDKACAHSKKLVSSLTSLKGVIAKEDHEADMPKIEALISECTNAHAYLDACKKTNGDDAKEVSGNLASVLESLAELSGSQALGSLEKEFQRYVSDLWLGDAGEVLPLTARDKAKTMQCFWKVAVQGRVN